MPMSQSDDPDPENSEQILNTLREEREHKATANEIVNQADGVNDVEQARHELRSLVDDGKVSQTPDWEYKLASRLK